VSTFMNQKGQTSSILIAGEAVNHMSHPLGSPKRKPVEVHRSATPRQLAGRRNGGLAHATESGGHPGNILVKPGADKQQSPPTVHPSMRSRTADTEGAAPGVNHAKASRNLDAALGQKILDQAGHVAGSRLIDHVPDCPKFSKC
jgi:hypothetical protein